MEILLTNTYSHLNKGDYGIVLGILDSFWEIDDEITFNLVSLHPDGDRRAYTDPRVTVIEAPFHGPADGEPLTTRLVHWLEQGLWRLPRTVWSSDDGTRGPREVRAFLQAARRSDLALACGGGYLHDSFGPALYIQLAQLWLADREDLPLYLLPQSIGPASGLHRRALSATLERAEGIYVREPVSFDYVQRLNLEVPLDLAPDPAFALEPASSEAARSQIEQLPTEGDLVGFTVRQWHFPGADGDPERLYERYLRAYGELIRDREGTTFAFLPQVTGPGDDDDRIALDDLVDVMGWDKLPDNVITLDPGLSPGEIITVVAEMDAFVGTRMHSNIFALRGRVPTLAVSYLPKTNGIMAMLDLEDWVIDIDQVTPERLEAGYERLMADEGAYQQRLEDVMPTIEAEARSPARRILEEEPTPPAVRA